MKIGLDFDGVIADCGQLKANGAKKFYGVSIPPEKFRKKIVLEAGYLTTEQYDTLQKLIYDTEGGALLLKPVRGLFRYLTRLMANGHTVVVITSRGDDGTKIAREWVADQKLSLEIISVGYGNSKGEAANGLDVFVDDDLEKLKQLVGIVPHRFLFSWGYNNHENAGNIATRVGSWKELYCAIQALPPPASLTKFEHYGILSVVPKTRSERRKQCPQKK
ncbi:MAG: hypothetical protein HYT21_02535 [Candidatus Nealsonbacteria bacterium]|nr:hypothetical protein [Candidatus Nealsonbacteria bacterium]